MKRCMMKNNNRSMKIKHRKNDTCEYKARTENREENSDKLEGKKGENFTCVKDMEDRVKIGWKVLV